MKNKHEKIPPTHTKNKNTTQDKTATKKQPGINTKKQNKNKKHKTKKHEKKKT